MDYAPGTEPVRISETTCVCRLGKPLEGAIRAFIAVLLILFALVPGAVASSYLPPDRTMASHEKLLHSCEIADGIVAVRVDRKFEDFYLDKQLPPNQGTILSGAECTVLEVLKGDFEVGQRIRVSLDTGNEGPCGVMFLFRSRVDFGRWGDGRHGSLPRWVLYSGPELFENGYATSSCKVNDPVRAQVAAAVRQSQPDRLAAGSDIVVVSEIRQRLESCTVDGKQRSCAILTTFDQVYGTRRSAPLRVVAQHYAYLRPGKYLLYLASVAPDVFEVVGLSAGLQAIDGGRVGHDRRRLRDVLAQIRKVEAMRRQDLR